VSETKLTFSFSAPFKARRSPIVAFKVIIGQNSWADCVRAVVLNLGFAKSQGFTGRFPGAVGWQLNFHVLLFC